MIGARVRQHRPFQLGAVTDTGSATIPSGWDSARTLNVHVPGISTDSIATIAIKNASGSAGLVFFHRGGGGGAYWDDGLQTDLINSLVAANYRLIQMYWSPPWLLAPSGARLGIARMAGRAASLIKYVHDTYSGGLQFVCVGHSNGAQVTSHSLVQYNLSSIIDVAVLCAGPPLSDIYRACNRQAGNENYWLANNTSGTANYPDQAHGYPGDDTGPCFTGDETQEGSLWRDSSLLSPDGRFNWPNTRVVMLHGSMDFTAASYQGLLLRDRMVTAGQSYNLGFVPQTDHTFTDTAQAREAIRAAVLNKVHLGVWGERTESSTMTATVVLNEAPEAGDMIVALRSCRTAMANVTTPSGWTRATASRNLPVGNRSVLVEYKVATGSEGTSFSFDITTSVRQVVVLAVVKNLTNPVIDQQANNSVSAGTTLTLTTPTTTSTDEITFAIIGVSGTNDFAQAWSGEYTQLGAEVAGDCSSAYGLLTATGAFATTETWTTARDAAGVIVTFKAS